MKKRDLILICAATAFVAILSLGTLFTPDISFSENENRYLQEAPEFTADSVLSGKFEAKMEDYLSDQIIWREGWVSRKSLVEAALGIRDINGVYLCSGGRVVERITDAEFNNERYMANLKEAAALAQACGQLTSPVPVNVMLVPTAAYVYRDELPKFAVTFDEDGAFETAADVLGDSLVDIRGDLKDGSEMTFFKTDHHWTGYGAFLGYEAYMERLNEGKRTDNVKRTDEDGQTGEVKSTDEALKRTDTAYQSLKPKILTTEFKGTLYSKVLLPFLGIDTIETPAAALAAKYTVRIDGKEYDSLYFMDYLEKKDKYAVYFGGNYDVVDIELTGKGKGTDEGVQTGEAGQTGEIRQTGEAKSTGEGTEGTRIGQTGEKLLIIKDSFANSFVPYLIGGFDKITMVDTRYYRGNVAELAKDYDRVLVLYGMDSFSKEKINLTKALLQ